MIFVEPFGADTFLGDVEILVKGSSGIPGYVGAVDQRVVESEDGDRRLGLATNDTNGIDSFVSLPMIVEILAVEKQAEVVGVGEATIFEPAGLEEVGEGVEETQGSKHDSALPLFKLCLRSKGTIDDVEIAKVFDRYFRVFFDNPLVEPSPVNDR